MAKSFSNIERHGCITVIPGVFLAVLGIHMRASLKPRYVRPWKRLESIQMM
jgi:hypothetical protein